MDLDGQWDFRLDPQNVGVSERWFDPQSQFTDAITVPGAWEAQGYGEPSGNLRHQYEGAAWYRKHLVIPSAWNGRLIILRIGGAHRLTRLFVNGTDFGEHRGFNAPFSYNITRAIRAGQDNVIALRIENPPFDVQSSPDKQIPTLPVGMFDYIANWGGIYGDVSLEAENPVHIESVLVSSDTSKHVATFRIRTSADRTSSASVRVSIPGAEPATSPLSAEPGKENEVTIAVPLSREPLWSPDHPELLAAKIQLLQNGSEVDSVTQSFGFRQVSTRGNVLLLNGRPLYLRAYGDDDVEVLNGFPPASPAVCLKRMQLAKSFGFNAVRFHSMTPPECYFKAADQVGILIMAELPAVYTQFFFAHRDFLYGELAATLLAYRNHPSLLSLAFGNEFNLRWLTTDADRKIMMHALNDFYTRAKQLAPATLIMSNDGFDLRPTDMVSTGTIPPPDRPTVRHEFGGYYGSLPDPSLIDRFNGVMIPAWLDAKKQWISENKLDFVYPEYLKNSIRLQQLGRKFQIERTRLDHTVTGYDYWLLVDFPGGTGEGDSWEEGWFDYVWTPKVSPEAGRELNSAVLPLIDAGVDERTLWSNETKHIGVSISNYGSEPIRNGVLSWTVTWNGKQLEGGELHGFDVPLGSVAKIGEILLLDPGDDHPRKLVLKTTLKSGSADYTNHWEFWVFPAGTLLSSSPGPITLNFEWPELQRVYPWLQRSSGMSAAGGLWITDKLDHAVMAHLHSGGRVLLAMHQQATGRGIPFFPSSGGAMGTLIPESAALGDFPNDGFADLQFENLLNGASPLPLDGWPAELTPFLGAIRTTSGFLSKQKGLSREAYIFEARVDRGKLLVTSPGLWNHYDQSHPAAVYLFDRMLRYAASDSFAPTVQLTDDLLQRLQAEE
ncbi:MAG TPA: hypothetical protein VGS10_10390 [Terracidiphilus sp.]|nr:hypothetical protein [Terracidiphilus sp.]